MVIIKQQWQRFINWARNKRDRWLLNRVPSENIIQLNINNTFILPSSFGWSCIGIIISLFVLGTNFQNNIILLLCYFLLAMMLLAVFHSYFFFTQHQISFLAITPDFENRQLYLPVQIHSKQDYEGGVLSFSVNKSISLSIELESRDQLIKVPLPKYKRGYYICPKISVTALYGFGLFRCWTHLTPKMNFYVYPAMQKSAVKLHRANADAQLAHSSDSQYVISDDLQGIREHQITDPIHHISWKHVAKGQGMLTKDFSENKGVSGWLRLADLQHLDIEQALQCLCYQIQQLDKDQVQFGLDLGSTKILPQEGQTHLHECLVQLTLFTYPKSRSQANTALDNSFLTSNTAG
jgi:uncharacterized protein (DUF58 family)